MTEGLATPFQVRYDAEAASIEEWMREHPDATAHDLAEWWGCAVSTVTRLMAKHGWRSKQGWRRD